MAQDLPEDILLHIFLKGCEDQVKNDTLDERTADVPSRVRKKFAALVRSVCTQWRAIIDQPTRFNDTHFWILFLFLQIPTVNTQITRIAKFQEALSLSKGCDVAFRLELSAEFEWNNTEDPPLRLLSTINPIFKLLLMPYQKQVVYIGMRGSQPSAWKHLLDILTEQFENNPRLVELEFQTQFLCKAPPLDFISNCTEFDTGVTLSHSQDPHPPYKLISLEHLSNIDTLTLPDITWIKKDVMCLPPAVSQMILSLGNQSLRKLPTWLMYLGSHTRLCNNLVSLTIRDDWRTGFYKNLNGNPSTISPHDTPKHFPDIVLHQLRRLHLQVPDIWCKEFLEHISHPHLETVSLKLSGYDNTNLPPSVSISPEFDGPSNLPALKSLDLQIPTTWASIACLKRFAKSSVDRLALQVFEHNKVAFRPDRSPMFSHLFLILSHFVPSSLVLSDLRYRNLCIMLKAISLSRVEELRIDTRYTNNFSTACIDLPGDIYPLDMLCSQLTELYLVLPSIHNCEHFLSSLYALWLKKVTIEISTSIHKEQSSRVADFRDWNRAHALKSRVFPSVQQLHFNFRNSGMLFLRRLRTILKLTPEAGAIHLKISEDLFSSAQEYFESRIIELCGMLEPTEEGLPLRHLSHVLVELHITSLAAANIDSERSSDRIKALSLQRARAGAAPLVLQQPVFYDTRPLLGGSRTFISLKFKLVAPSETDRILKLLEGLSIYNN